MGRVCTQSREGHGRQPAGTTTTHMWNTKIKAQTQSDCNPHRFIVVVVVVVIIIIIIRPIIIIIIIITVTGLNGLNNQLLG